MYTGTGERWLSDEIFSSPWNLWQAMFWHEAASPKASSLWHGLAGQCCPACPSLLPQAAWGHGSTPCTHIRKMSTCLCPATPQLQSSQSCVSITRPSAFCQLHEVHGFWNCRNLCIAFCHSVWIGWEIKSDAPNNLMCRTATFVCRRDSQQRCWWSCFVQDKQL